jgi:hypothetical protein
LAKRVSGGGAFTRPTFAHRVPNGDLVRARHERAAAGAIAYHQLEEDFERKARGMAPTTRIAAEAAVEKVTSLNARRSLTFTLFWDTCPFNPEADPDAFRTSDDPFPNKTSLRPGHKEPSLGPRWNLRRTRFL